MLNNLCSQRFASSISFSLALLTCILPSTAAPQRSQNQRFRTQPWRTDEYWVPSPNVIAYYILELELQNVPSRSSAIVQGLRQGLQIDGIKGEYADAKLNSTNRGLTFITPIKIGSQTFQVVVDTGSSDTWLVHGGFQCLAAGTNDHLSEAACNFGPAYTPEKTFKPIPNVNFDIDYSDGESLTGTFGKETVSIAGITVPDQQIAIVNEAAYNGDGVTSGLLGLAFPGNTRAYAGNDSRLNSVNNQRTYNPIFTNMYRNGDIPPLFSIALDRNTHGGYLAFGGLPPVAHNGWFASSPIEILSTSSSSSNSSKPATGTFTLYAITTEGFTYASGDSTRGKSSPSIYAKPTDPTQVQMIVDSGTSIISLPQEAADAVNQLFEPKPFYRDPAGYYIIPCNAKAPQFGVRIGMQTFYIDPKDMVVNEGGQCISGVGATAPGGINVLGHTFLKNVIAVFDIGANVMRFAAREKY